MGGKLKLADGKMYVTRDGRTVGPIRRRMLGAEEWFSVQFFDEAVRYTRSGWHPDGTFIEGCESKLDLVRSTRRRAPSSKEGRDA